MIGLKYIAPVYDKSGYANAARDYIKSLIKLKINLTIDPISFEDRNTLQDEDKILSSYINKNIEYDTIIVHLTAEHIPKYIEKDKKIISYSTWETDKISEHWVNIFNNYVDICLVPSEYNKKTYIKSGCNKPIYIVPHIVSRITQIENIKLNINNEYYKFYNIIQWTNRKNYKGLLQAYFTEFKYDEKVILIIKTFFNGNSNDNKAIIDDINKIKSELGLKKYPKLYIINEFLETKQIYGLHKFCDCLVAPHKSEGWGLVPMEAIMLKNPVITTYYGGVTEYLPKDYPLNITKYIEEPVVNMHRLSPYYDGTQMWANPCIKQLKEKMRTIYNNRDKISNEFNITLSNLLYDKYNKDIIGNKLLNIIKYEGK